MRLKRNNGHKKHFKLYKHYSLKVTFIIPKHDTEARNQKRKYLVYLIHIFYLWKNDHKLYNIKRRKCSMHDKNVSRMNYNIKALSKYKNHA